MATIKQFIVTNPEDDKELSFFLNTEAMLYIGIKTIEEPENEAWIIADKEEVQFIINALNDLIKEM